MTDASFPTAAVITASDAIFVWALTRIAEYFQNNIKKRSDAKKYISALYAEIDFNTRDMEIFLKESASIEAVVKKVKAYKDFIPHITDARHTFIYSEGLANIHHIGKEQIGQLVYFYGLLEKLRNQVGGIYLVSFGKISPAGREATIREVAESAEEIERVGRVVLEELEIKHRDMALTRTIRHQSVSGLTEAQLKERHQTFSSDFDRVYTKHRKSP